MARLHAEQEGVEHIGISPNSSGAARRRTSRTIRCRDLHGNVGTRTQSSLNREACHKLVKPGGHVFFSTINRNPKAYLFAIIGAEYVPVHVSQKAPTIIKNSLSPQNWHMISRRRAQTERHDGFTLQSIDQTSFIG